MYALIGWKRVLYQSTEHAHLENGEPIFGFASASWRIWPKNKCPLWLRQTQSKQAICLQ